MHIGHYISGGAHAGLIFWILFGGMSAPEPLPIETVPTSIMTGAEFDAMVASYQQPLVDMAAQELQQTPTADTPPNLESLKDDIVASVSPPARPDQTVEITKPQPVEPLETPQVEPVIPDQPTAPQEAALDLPVTRPNAAPLPADRVAPEPVAPPKEDAAIDEQVQDSVALADAGQKTDQTEQEAKAPEAATTEIVTEAKKEPPSGAPKTSPRPRQRPAEPQVETTEAAPIEPQQSDTASVQDALAQAMSSAASEPSGPPMTQGETDSFRISVQKCWVVDVGSEAANVTVTVAMSLDRDGKVDDNSLKLLASEGGSESAANTAFRAARRAILRCQKDGYKLPVEKYDHWRDIEITFNPEEMRTR